MGGGNKVKYVICKIGDVEYAISITVVSSIEKIPTIYELPLTPLFVPGVISYRGKIITVVETSQLLKISDNNLIDPNSRKIVVVQDLNEIVGLIVDRTLDIIDIDKRIIKKSKNNFVDMVDLESRIVFILKTNELIDYARANTF